MLIEFSVKNFKSFKDKVTFSMEKDIGEDHTNNFFNINNVSLLKTSAIYGANASGKSNLVKALTTAILMVRNSNMISVGGKWSTVVPFFLDEISRKEPSMFEFEFITNGIKYKYGFSADNVKIYDEFLEAYYSQKATTIFSRTNTNEYKFLIADENKLRSIESKNTENKLFLATATNWNYDKTKDAFLWFMNCIDTYDQFEFITDQDLINYSNAGNELKNFSLKLLREADIFIKDLHVYYEEKEMDSTMADMIIPSYARNQGIAKMKNVSIEVEHEVIDGNGESRTYKLNFMDESSGTRILFALAPFLKRAFSNTRIIVVDELEKSLHPVLVEYIVKIFNNPNLNKANSQLIFTTHSVNLLDLDVFRRDQIWFTEKNSNSGETDLYSLSDFSVRKTENIQKGYLNGRYGAIPFIKNSDILWRE